MIQTKEIIPDDLRKNCKPGFMFVTLDLKGYRTGSMNATQARKS